MTRFAAPISEQIWDMKYRLKQADGTPLDNTVEDSWRRIANAIAEAEPENQRAAWSDKFYDALAGFKYLPAGRITAGAGSGRNVTLFNCFVMGTIPDSMSGIFDALKEAALTMQQGGGIGYDFSTIRPKGSEVKGVAADASGPLSFMDVWDAMCRTVMSAGSRRGAMMATMRCDHPDIEAFIDAKRDPNRLRMFNLSVLVTDAFMDAVALDAPWRLHFENLHGELLLERTVSARDLWNRMMKATYDVAEPGVIFIDRINQANNLRYCETISATNPCVPAGTPILTKRGWWPIEEVIDREVDVWNGSEWSTVVPTITGHQQRLITVKMSDGTELTCTPSHRFVLQDGSRVPASDLVSGNKLTRGAWPIISGHIDYAFAYDQGFFSGDGTQKSTGEQYIYLYGKKKALEEELAGPLSRGEYAISGGYEGTDLNQTKVYLNYGRQTFLPKDFVPGADWDIDSRIRWLEGICDSDGCAYRSYNSVLIQISAKNKAFLQNLMLMLTTLGVSGHLAAMKDCWRIGISASNVARLQQLGFAPKRLDIDGNKPQREAARFVRVMSIEPVSEIAETVYCFTESKRHMGCFNGVLTGQCGEQPLPPYGACLLGSINLPMFVKNAFTRGVRIDIEAIKETVATAVRMMDNVIDVSNFPHDQQAQEARDKRRIGLGVTGLADVLIMIGLTYGSQQAAAFTAKLMEKIAVAAYSASVELSKERGFFPLFDAKKYLEPGTAASALPSWLQEQIHKYGIRNGLLTSIAPTGTISLYAGNVSSGIEPVFAYNYTRKVLQKDGTKTEEDVEDFAYRAYKEYFYANIYSPDNHASSEWTDDFLPSQFVSAQTLAPEDHVVMQAAAQLWVDSAISKTVNCPEDISFDDFKEIYLTAHRSNCKGCTTYRPNATTGSILSVEPAAAVPLEAPAVAIPEELPIERPDELPGAVYKLRWPGTPHALYVTLTDIIDPHTGQRRPFEIFFNSKSMEHFSWTVALSRMISAVFRRPHDSKFVVEELKAVFDPKGGTWLNGKFVPSVIAAIGGIIQQHMEGIGYMELKLKEPHDPAHLMKDAPVVGPTCSECGSDNVKKESGCFTCKDCGTSKCG